MKTQQALPSSILTKLLILSKTSIVFTLALILSITSLTALITPKAGATSLPNVVADPTFNIGSGFDSTVRHIEPLTSGGYIVVGNFTSYNGIPVGHIAKLSSNGTLDTSFNSGGVGFDNQAQYINIDSYKNIIVYGIFTSYNGIPVGRIAKLSSNGTLDTSFNSGGSGFNGTLRAEPLELPDGSILVGGWFTSYNGIPVGRIAKLSSNGTLDTSFNSGGSGFDKNAVDSISLNSANYILVGGTFTAYNGVLASPVVALNFDGSVNNSFNASGMNGSTEVSRFIQDKDGGVWLGGYFTQYNGKVANRIVKTYANGNIDESLDFGAGFDNNVASIAKHDKYILVGGWFTSYQGTPHNRLIRLMITPDKDSDGLDDTIEDSTANNGDANNDSILDSNQNNVSSFINPITNKTSSIQVDPTCTLSNITTKEESKLNTQDNNYTYPLGLYDFTANCGTPGYTTQVKLYNYETPTSTNYITRKYNPNTNLYSDITGAYLEDTTINNLPVKVANYTLTDGSQNDTDNQTNGTIVDPVGLATTNPVAMVNAPNTGVSNNKSLIAIIMLISLATLASIIVYKNRSRAYKIN